MIKKLLLTALFIPVIVFAQSQVLPFSRGGTGTTTCPSGYVPQSDGTAYMCTDTLTGLTSVTATTGTFNTLNAGTIFAQLGLGTGDVDIDGKLDVAGIITALGGTSTNWNDAYTHALLTTGNPHAVTASQVGIDSTDDIPEGVTNEYSKWDDATGGINYAGGNVGVGTTSPNNKLSIAGGISIDGGSFVSDDIPQIWGASNLLILGGGTGGFLFRDDDNNTQMAIDSSGNVGIGTTSPKGLLEVNNGTAAAVLDASVNVASLYLSESETSPTASAFARLRYDGADNKFHISTFRAVGGDTEALTILRDDGYVGIGTTSPQFPLQIENGGANTTLKFGVDSGSLGSILSRGTGSSDKYKDIIITANDIFLSTATSFEGSGSDKRVTIKHTTGNVGIGTTSPNAKLDVWNGAFGLSDSNTGHGITNLLPTNTFASLFKINNNGGGTLRGISEIGGDNPGILINGVVGANTVSSGAIHYDGRIGSGTGAGNTGDKIAHKFLSSTTELMNILGNGNVGIGTTSPQTHLHIADVGTPEIRLEDTTNNAYSSIRSGDVASLFISADDGDDFANSAMVFKVDNSEYMRLDSAGNVGIGTTSPNTDLEIAGSGFTAMAIDAIGNGDSQVVFRNDGSNKWVLGSDDDFLFNFHIRGDGGGADEFFTISQAGNVGIGTINPKSKLHVTGLPEYTDNAAALVGGLTAGAFYRTGDLLKVVH